MVATRPGQHSQGRRGGPPAPGPRTADAPAMNAATLGIASDFVKTGIEKAGIPLTQTLEAYLSITFARFIGAAIARRSADGAHHPGDGRQRAARHACAALADECLIACAFFEERLRRNGTIRHYVGLGQMTYDAAELTEQAYGFVHMRDVIASAAGRRAPRTAASWSTAPAPAARPPAPSSPSRTSSSAPGAAARSRACSGAEAAQASGSGSAAAPLLLAPSLAWRRGRACRTRS